MALPPLTRLRAMIIKEIWALLRDPKARIVLVVPPILQLFVFSFATTLDVTNIDLGLWRQSHGAVSTELIGAIAGSPRFRRLVPIASPGDMRAAIEQRRVIGVLVIPPDFDATAQAGQSAPLGLVLDGRRSNATQIVASYIGTIAAGVSARIAPRALALGQTRITYWYNPALDYIWFTLPSLVTILLSVSGLAITSQSVARERELGNFDQLMVSPLRVPEILVGKMAPPLLVGLITGNVFMILAQIVFGVPFTGSIALYELALVVYLLALIGVGLLISSAALTQQQAFLGSFLVSTPLIMLSGYSSPIDNMPGWLQTVTYANPARYFLILVQGLFLKAMPLRLAWQQLWPLMLIAACTLTAAGRLFRARME